MLRLFGGNAFKSMSPWGNIKAHRIICNGTLVNTMSSKDTKDIIKSDKNNNSNNNDNNSSNDGSRKLALSKPQNANKLRRPSSGVDGMDLFEVDAMKTSLGAFGDKSFRVGDRLIRQSVILLPQSILLWDISRPEEITIESLAVFELIYPTIEVLFIGTGNTMPDEYPFELVKYFKTKGINVEVSRTATAAGLFNTLNTEGRNVAAALLTLVPVTQSEVKFYDGEE